MDQTFSRKKGREPEFIEKKKQLLFSFEVYLILMIVNIKNNSKNFERNKILSSQYIKTNKKIEHILHYHRFRFQFKDGNFKVTSSCTRITIQSFLSFNTCIRRLLTKSFHVQDMKIYIINIFATFIHKAQFIHNSF